VELKQSQHVFFLDGGSLGDRLRAMHDRMLESMPFVDRVACVLYDPATDMLKTFINSTRVGVPIDGYEFALSESESLSHLANTASIRVIDDIAAVVNPDSPHSRWLLEQGYCSSFTIPLFDCGKFYGLLFFNSTQIAAFTPIRQRDLLMYSNLMTMAITSEREAVRSILNSAAVAREIAELRDFETGAHLQRMAHYSRLIARGVAQDYGLNDEAIEHIFLFAPLHDIGKVGIPDAILLKPGRLNPEERRIMETHVDLGLTLAERVLGRLHVEGLPDSSILTNIIAGHHECLDGSGYPRGLVGDEVAVEARIVAVADIFDALSSPRPYKKQWTVEESMLELNSMVTQGKLDALCVKALGDNLEEARMIAQRMRD
jgi:HD-GYP domain-containing protein (c-di-GMP phosphodiesterase class II)